MIAEDIIQSNVKNLNRVFDYKIPESYEADAMELLGARVLVPFGRMKQLEEGYIVNIKQDSEFEVKEIASVQEKYLDINKINFANRQNFVKTLLKNVKYDILKSLKLIKIKIIGSNNKIS